jgi:hypothetical protein
MCWCTPELRTPCCGKPGYYPKEQQSSEDKILNLLCKIAGDSGDEPNLIDVISRSSGWRPLESNNVMQVHYGDRAYTITRDK